MSKFDLPHLINFFDDKNNTRLNSSYLLQEGIEFSLTKRNIIIMPKKTSTL